ncbi:MAG: hypothetical protein KDK08_02330, partial [Rhizobiaceae bacterium]|nr:hypothetical protein [Rhizobiaceae bacterium]
MIEIAIEALVDGDAMRPLPVPYRRNDTRGRGLDDLADHAVLHAKRTLVFQEDNLIAGGKLSGSILGPEGVADLDQPPLDELFARHGVELADIA